MLKDKDRIAIFRELVEITDVWHVVTLQDSRGADCQTLANEVREIGTDERICCYDSIPVALDNIRSIVYPKDRIIVTGSFLSVGAAITHLKLQH